MLQTSSVSVVSQTHPDVRLRVATTREDRLAAFRLVYQSYLRSGLCTAHPQGIRITEHQLLSTSDIFIAEIHDTVICTMTIVRDSEHGLPADDLYRDELDYRRNEGHQLAEIGCLADRRQHASRFLPLFIDMGRLIVQFAHQHGVSHLVASMHPKHAALYRRCMGFEQFGDRYNYHAVCDRPAVGMALDIAETARKNPGMKSRFFDPPIPPEVLEPCPISAADCDYFEQELLPEQWRAMA